MRGGGEGKWGRRSVGHPAPDAGQLNWYLIKSDDGCGRAVLVRPAAIRQRGRRPTPGGRPAVIDTTTLMMIALPRPVSTRLSRHSLRGDSLLRAIHQSRSGVNALNKPNETTIFWGKKKIYIYKYMFIYLCSFTTGANVGYCIGTFFLFSYGFW